MDKKNSSLKYLVIVVLFWFAQYVFIPYFTPYLDGQSISASLIGLITGTYGFSQLIIRIPFGIAADKLQNHVLFMKIGFVAVILAGILLCFARHPAAFFAARFLAGLSSSTWVSFTVYYSAIHQGSAKAVSTILLANNMGVLLSYLLGLVLFDRLGILPLFLCSVAAGIAGLVLLFTYRAKATVNKSNITLRAVKGVLAERNLLTHSFLAALVQLVVFATAASFTANYARELGANGMQLSLLSIVFTAAAIGGSYFVATDYRLRFTERQLYAGSFFLLALYCFLVPACRSLGSLYLVQILCGFGRAVLLSQTMSLSAQKIEPALKSTAMGVYQCIYSLGMTAGPILIGLMLDLSGQYRTAFFSIGLFGAAGIPLSLIAIKKSASD